MRACSCCCCCHHDYARLPQTMFHVSFRYIFGIPPLILVLLPVTSSDCDIEGKEGKEYENILMVNINELDSMIKVDNNCTNNESNFFKKHSCDDNKEAMFQYRAARKLRQFLKMNKNESFSIHLSIVSEGTLSLLNCKQLTVLGKSAKLWIQGIQKTKLKFSDILFLNEISILLPNKVKGRKALSLGEAQPTKKLEENKSLKEQKKQSDLCFLKTLLQKIKTCWNKILRDAKKP